MESQDISSSLEANLKILDLAQCIRQCGWSTRRGCKISALNECLSLCLVGAADCCSLRLVALHLGLQGRFTATKNPVYKRLAKGGDEDPGLFRNRHSVFANFKLVSFRDNDQGSTLEALDRPKLNTSLWTFG